MNTLKLSILFLFGAISFTTAQTTTIEKTNAIFPVPTIEKAVENEEALSAVLLDQESILILWEFPKEEVYFEIERSVDGENYEMIASSEDIPVPSDYVEISPDGIMIQFLDDAPNAENHYRIFYITPEGSVDYSNEVFVSPLPEEMTIEGLE